MTREQVLINHIQEYLDSGMWQYEACYLNKDDLKVIIKALEQEPCEDVINRDELLKAIDTWDKFGCDADTKLVPYQDHYIPYIHYDDVVKCIKGMPSVIPQSKWIPVSERLPETDDDVLVTDGVDMFVAWYKGQGWMSSDNNFEINTPIDAWMPLPKPYKIESEGYKVGHWYKSSCDICYTCSFCGATNASGTKYSYCPHCGAKMTESEVKV